MSHVVFVLWGQPRAAAFVAHWRRMVWLGLAAGLLWACGADAQTIVTPAGVGRPFTQRASIDAKGDIAMVGNTFAKCDTATYASACESASNYTYMTYVDIDGVAATRASSSADLALPAGAQVQKAYLYWGGRAANSAADRNKIQVRAPGAAAYTEVTALNLDSLSPSGVGTYIPFMAVADVTSIVQAAGSGSYLVGSTSVYIPTANYDTLGYYGGWSLVVIYTDATQPYRRLALNDGAVLVDSSGGAGTVNVTISGLRTPAAKPFGAYVGAVVWEGDRGNVGDYFQLNNTNISDAVNPATDFWNSTISRNGVKLTAKNPNNDNQYGMDIDYVDASAAMPANATSATVTFGTNGDVYFPHALAFVVDLYAPDLTSSFTKAAADVNAGTLQPGDEIEYTLTFDNTGKDGAINTMVVDPIPTNTSYKPGSLSIRNTGASTTYTAVTDAPGDDLAEYDAANGRVVFRLGVGATATQGGTVLAAQSAAAKFRVVVNANPALSGGKTISNTATVTYNGQTLTSFNGNGTATADLVVESPATVALRKVTVGGVDGPFGFTLNNAYSGSGTVTVTTTSPGTPGTQVDGDGTVAGVQPFYVKSAGLGQDLTIQEASLPSSAWSLTGAQCQRVSAPAGLVGTLNAATRTYTIPGAAVTAGSQFDCVFTNAKTGTITIKKVAVPQDAQDFGFTVTGTGLTAFSLDDDADPTLSNTKTFSGLASGAYTITETAQAGWPLTALTCTATTPATGGSSTFTADKATAKASITLVAGEAVDCTFTNTANIADLSIQKTNGTTTLTPGASTTYTIKVTNKGPATVTGAVVKDFGVTGLTCPSTGSASCTGPGCPAATVPYADLLGASGVVLGTLAPNGEVAIAVTCTVN